MSDEYGRHAGTTSAGRNRKEEERITHSVSELYGKTPFPGIRPPDQDGLILMRRLMKQPSAPARILDAGCGTGNTSISLARMLTDTRFLGLDLCDASLTQARMASEEAGLANICFERWNLLDPIQDNGLFDVILCLGVLHHTANMTTVLSNLQRVLSRDGKLYLWVYGLHGRYKHALNQRLLEMLHSAGPEPEDLIDLIRDFISGDKQGIVLNDWLGQHALDEMHLKALEGDVWLADQFLHPREELVDMERLLGILEEAGLKMKQWLGVNPDPTAHFSSVEMINRFNRLSRQEQLVALDLLLKRDRYFIVAERA
jgi:SAM-dependent methyltransferase